MPETKYLYEQLLEKGYSKQSIHNVLHQLMLEDIKQQRLYEKKSFTGKILWHYKRYSEQVTGCAGKTGSPEAGKSGRRKARVMLHKPGTRKFSINIKHLTAKGLVLLKTLFARKPKNPV